MRLLNVLLGSLLIGSARVEVEALEAELISEVPLAEPGKTFGSLSALLVDRRLGHHRDAEKAEVAEEVQESRSDPRGSLICVRIHHPLRDLHNL